jgi:Tfp pilus assembly PilM family ATPase
MSGNKSDISSNDRLIGLIKGSKESRDGNAATEVDVVGRSRPKVLDAIRLKTSRGATVGVDIAETQLRMVKTIQKSSHEFVLEDYVTLPFPNGIARGGPGFSAFLRESLANFGVSNKDKVWSSISSVGVDVGHVKIPKVSRDKIANTVYFTVKMENPFDEKNFFLDFELQGEIVDNGVNKLRVLYYLSPRSAVNELKSIFSKAGIQIAGLSLGPFLNQNFFRTGWIEPGDAPVGTLHIGRNWSRIDIFDSGNLMLTRDIKAGLHSMVEALLDSFREHVPGTEESGVEGYTIDAGLSLDSVEEPPVVFFEEIDNRIDDDGVPAVSPGDEPEGGIAENSPPAGKPSIEEDQAWKILTSLGCESSILQPGEPGYELSDEEKFEMVKPAAERLMRQVERTFEYYATSLGFERVQRIFVTGALDGCSRLADYIGEELGMDRDILDPMAPQNPAMGKIPPPDSLKERMTYTFATGLSLSDNSRTPNLIYPYEAKDKISRVSRFNKLIFMFFLVLITVFGGYHLWQRSVENRKKETIATLQSQMAKYSVTVDKKLILSLVGDLSNAKAAVEKVSERYLSVAVLGELAEYTPEAVRILTADMVVPRAQKGKNPAGSKARAASVIAVRTLQLEGLVFGDAKQFDTILTAYIMKLESSTLFRNPRVEKTEAHEYKDKDVLRFTLRLEVM